MQSFVAWRGEVPPEAKPLEDFEARAHAATWVRLNIGKGIAGAYVIGFQCGDTWWSYFFERISRDEAPDGTESWRVEAYDSRGQSWRNDYLCCPSENRWTGPLPGPPPGRREPTADQE
jgi:hypothetical protein